MIHMHLIAVGQKMPGWVQTAYQEYAVRFPKDFDLKLIEIPAEKRSKQSHTPTILSKEGTLIQKAIPKGARVVALDVLGKAWSTPELAQQLSHWHTNYAHVAFLVGGPEGLSPECLALADQRWSLSPLTFPHPLVRVIVAEQLFRAWSILNNHPYHRD